MNILLIDIDSMIPNLALMKISAYHKSRGDNVGFSVSDPDIIYASVIFRQNKHLVDGLSFFYPNAEIVIGGVGYDMQTKLPAEIERIRPDYTLYPDMDYSLGYTSRGCPNSCYFCVIPQTEGKHQRWQHPSEWHNPDFKKARILDPNWYADPDWFFETSQWFMDRDIAIDVSQGFDIRRITPGIAYQIKKLKFWKPIHFAWDDEKDEVKIMRGIEILKNMGMKNELRHSTLFYVYCHDPDQHESALYRCRKLKEMDVGAFVMYNIDIPKTQEIIDLQRWANRPWIYWSIDYDEYRRRREVK
ncbi:MAG: hypothetical protein PHI12_11130 [Dehalococcoidales bacterium]|nr:hypothetical protein [Dehalococcoidales bacterium]